MNFCVMCGRTLPDENGSQVCRHCELTAGIKFFEYTCPECGSKMEIYYKEVVTHKGASWDCFPTLVVDLIYHCDHCGCDWDSQYSSSWGDEGQTFPSRHYWG